MKINIIYNEDCFETFKKIDDKSIDMILCDLPYGSTACKWDTRIPLEPLWKEYKRIIKKNGAIVLMASQPFTSVLVMSNLEWFRYEWIWEKTRATNFLNYSINPAKVHENIIVFYERVGVYNPQMEDGLPYLDNRKPKNRGLSSVVSSELLNTGRQNTGQRFPKSIQQFQNPNNKSIHPTQKPLALFEYLIKTYTNEGDLVLDNCIGSGTTAIACLNTNRNYIGCELNKDYYNICIERVEEYTRSN